MSDLKVTREKGELVIRIPFDEKGSPSASGKTTVHSSTRGNQAVAIGNKQLYVGVNVYSK